MIESLPDKYLQVRSLVTAQGELELSLAETPIPQLQPNQVLVRVDASPINPSDLMLFLAGANPEDLRAEGTPQRPVVRGPLSEAAIARAAGRVGLNLTAGNEGAGVVVAAGAQAQALIGRTVAAGVGGMFTQYRVVKAANCLVLPGDVTAQEGCAAIVNPTTALGMVETMRLDGHCALVHTAAASSLGQMLHRLCQADGVELVNIVRRPAQAALLRAQGARWVCDSSDPGFEAALIHALSETGATVAFDAIGGGEMAGRMLAAMEAAVNARTPEFARYGSPVHKQVYIYGALDDGPTVFTRDFGWAWSLGGWSIPAFTGRIGEDAAQRLRQRMVAELRTTFATAFTRSLAPAEMLDPANIAAYAALATGEKFMLKPHG